MSEFWLMECANCNRQTMVSRYDDLCQFCNKLVNKKETYLLEAIEPKPVIVPSTVLEVKENGKEVIMQ